MGNQGILEVQMPVGKWAVMDGGMQGGGEGGPGQPPGGTLGTDGNQELGDPNIPPDTINQGGTAPADNGQPPQPTDMATATGAQQEPSKKPPTFIYNAHSEDSIPYTKMLMVLLCS